MSSPTTKEEKPSSPSTPTVGSPPTSPQVKASPSKADAQKVSIGAGTKGLDAENAAVKTPEDGSALGASGTKEEDVQELSAMFPVIDVSVIAAVLSSTGSKDQAAEQLLGMTDPSFTPSLSEREQQTSLDADFAQALHLQDRDLARNQFLPPPPAPPYRGSFAPPPVRREGRLRDQIAARLDRPEYPPFDPQTYVPPYQPRVRRSRAPRHAPDPYDGDYAKAQQLQAKYGDDDVQFSEIEKKLVNMAEQGKQTFNTLYSRARAKYDEYSHDRGQNPHTGFVAGAQARINTFLGPNSPASNTDPHNAYVTASSRRWSPTDLEDVEDAQPLSPDTVNGKLSPRNKAGDSSPSARPTSPSKLDLSKLGFLPKKRVELLSASGDNSVQSPTTPTRASIASKTKPESRVSEVSPHQLGDSDDDDDDLGYTTNPFDKK